MSYNLTQAEYCVRRMTEAILNHLRTLVADEARELELFEVGMERACETKGGVITCHHGS